MHIEALYVCYRAGCACMKCVLSLRRYAACAARVCTRTERKDVDVGIHTRLGVALPRLPTVLAAVPVDRLIKTEQCGRFAGEVRLHPVLRRPTIAISQASRVACVPVPAAVGTSPGVAEKRQAIATPASVTMGYGANLPPLSSPQLMETARSVAKQGTAGLVHFRRWRRRRLQRRWRRRRRLRWARG